MGFLLTDAYMRNFTGALDASCVQSTKAALQTYMYSDATCYAGQIVAVVSDTTAANNGLYLITANASFKSGTAKSATNSPFVATQYSSAAAVETAITNMAGVLKFMGVFPDGSTLASSKAKKGYAWLVTTDSGTERSNGVISYGFFDTAGIKLEAGDLVICIDGDTEFSLVNASADKFAVINKNIERSVSSNATAPADAELVVFDGTTGKQVKGGSQTLASLKSECKNLANATGTLPISKGGTGATTLAGAKTALGIDALETALQNLTGGGSSAASATKLATARSLAYNHPVLGSLGEYKNNTFDGSKNMTALAIDGIYTGSGIPATITTNFPGWAIVGTAITMTDASREHVTAIELTSGSGCGSLLNQIKRFRRVYVNGSIPVELRQITDTQFVGEATINGKECLVCIFQHEYGGGYYVEQYILPKKGTMLTDSTFQYIIEGLENNIGILTSVLPIGTEFVNTATGTTYIYNGYEDGANRFIKMGWQ